MLARILSFKIRLQLNSDLKFQVRVVCKHEEFNNLFYTFFLLNLAKKSQNQLTSLRPNCQTVTRTSRWTTATAKNQNRPPVRGNSHISYSYNQRQLYLLLTNGLVFKKV